MTGTRYAFRHFAMLAAAGVLLTALALSPALGATGATFVRAQSGRGFGGTVSALKKSISGNGMMVMGHVNQAKVLSTTGLHLKGGESFLVGNPRVGKKLFRVSPAVGAVLPLRMYVWEHDGRTWVGYFKPSDLLDGIDPHLAKPAHRMDRKFRAILTGATR